MHNLIFQIVNRQIPSMKRKHSSEQFLSQNAINDPLARKRSPNFNKPKSKSKLEQTLFIGLGKGKVNRSKQEITYKESNNSTTNCTYVRPRNTKIAKKHKQKEEIVPKESKMKQNEIMNIINTFAIKIQRQWRVHQLRTKFKLFLKQIQDEKKKGVGQRQAIQRHNYSSKLKFNQKPEKHVKYIEDSNIEQNDNFYDHQKYQKSSLSSIVQLREANNSIGYLSEKNKNEGDCAFSSIQIKVPFQKELPKIKKDQQRKSLDRQTKSRDSQECKNVIKRQVQIQSKSFSKVPDTIQILSTQLNPKQINDRRASYDYCKAKQFSEVRRHSTGQVESLLKKQQKCFQIDKAFEIRIDKNEQCQKTDEKEAKPVFQIKSRGELSSRSIRRVDNDKNAFNIKFPLDKVLKKYKKQLQIAKLKKLLSIQNRFNRNEITEGLYSQTITKIHEQHRFKLQQFNEREVSIKYNWLELFNIHKISSLKLSHKYLEDVPDLQNSVSNIEVSTSFEKWDFNSSAKKSIDSHLDFTENAPHSSKIMSIESVLKELEDEDKEKEDDRKFKKNKSLQMIEVIAQRSKEVSQKQMDSIHQVAELNLQSQKKETHPIIIEDVEPFQFDEKRVQSDLFTPKLQSRQKFIQIQASSIEKGQIKENNLQQKIKADKLISETKSDGQSLLISQIQVLSQHEYISSDPSFSNIEEKNFLKDLIFKDFKASYQRSQTQLKENSIQSFIQQEESQLLEVEEQNISPDRNKGNLAEMLSRRFVDFVNQKVILNSIKTINSIKFILAKVSEHIKMDKLKVQSLTFCPRLQTDIFAINTWLLEISHFILDKYKPVILDNLVNVKQPPSQELLHLSKTNSLYYKIYETISQSVFKDFQFYYIKTLAENAHIPTQKFDIFSSLLYTFHRSLVDALNISLTDELSTDRNWLMLPWKTAFRKKRRVVVEHAKICLQRSINLVSNWGQFGLGRLEYEDEMQRLQNTQYEQQKIMLVCRQQTLDIPLSFIFTESHMLLLLSQQIFSDEIAFAIGEISTLI